MGIKTVILDGGLSLVLSPQQAPPGSLRSCKNFEVAFNRGYREIQGMKAFSGGVGNGVVDPYVLHSFGDSEGVNLENVSGTFTTGAEGWIIKWGSGGNYNAKTGQLTTVDGYASVCFSRRASASLILLALYDINGRMPAPGDVIVSDVYSITATLFRAPILASNMVEASIATFGSSYSNPVGGVDGASQLIHDFDCGPSITSSIARMLPVNPLGSIKGQFYFKDSLYVIGDIETWSFTGGNEEPSVGDSFFIYYSGTAFTGNAYSYIVEKVETTSGDWGAGTAAGKIWLVLEVGTGSMSTVIAPTDCGNDTTSTASPLTLSALVRSSGAGLWKSIGQSLTLGTSGSLWERQDLGYEVRFSGGDNYFTVLNRSNRDTALELGTPSTVSGGAGTGAGGWTNPSNATGVADASVATQANGSGPGPALRLTNYGFNLPENAVILGVKVTITRGRTAGGVIEGVRDSEIKLIGVSQSQNKKRNELWTVGGLAAVDYGGTSDLWDASLTPSIVNSTDFGVSIIAENVNNAGATTRQVDSAVIEITYKDRSSVVYFGDATTIATTAETSVLTFATITTASAHGYTTGQTVLISGVTPAAYNGSYVITVTSTTQFTYTFAGGVGAGTVRGTTFRNFSTARAIWYHKEKGDWSTTDAQGTLTLYEVSNPAEIRTGQYIRATAGSSGATLAIAASGADKVYFESSNALETNASQWEFTDEFNFFGARGTEQIAGASGAGLAFTWDGTYCIRMRTGVDATQDKPRHVAKIGDQLALGYIEGVTIVSDLGYPESYAGVVGGTLGGSSPISDDTVTYVFGGGAQEIKHGDSVYGYLSLADQNAAVFCRNSIQMLVGSGGSLVTKLIPGSSGIIEYTHADIGVPVFLDYRGIGTLSATAAFGDFARGRLSDEVAPWLIPRLQETGASFVSTSGPIRSEVIRNKNQLRIYFRDKWCLTMTLTGNDFSSPQFTTQLLPFVPASTCTGVTSGGKDLLFLAPFGMAEYGAFSNDLKAEYEADSAIVPDSNLYAPAFVYQGDVGTSWDNKLPIEAFIEVNGGAFGKEWQIDKMHSMIVSGQCYGFASFGAQFGVDFEPVDISRTVNWNGGTTAGNSAHAFIERPFSKQENVKLDGYAFSVKFVSSGASVYGDTSTQTSPYKFRPFTLQAIIGLDEALKIRRGGS